MAMGCRFDIIVSILYVRYQKGTTNTQLHLIANT